MKHKYRLVAFEINGKTYFQIQAKFKGLLGIFFRWSNEWVGSYKDYDLLFEDFDKALDAIADLRSTKKIKGKVIKGI